jgi:hypothetical protein
MAAKEEPKAEQAPTLAGTGE